MRKLSNEYVAGFIDGEGWIGLTKVRKVNNIYKYMSLRISISQTSKKVLKLIQDKFGGKLTGPLDYTVKGNGKPFYALRWWAKPELKKLLTAIQPFIIVKQKQVQVALEFLELRNLPKAERCLIKQSNNVFGVSYNTKASITKRELRLLKRIRKLNKRGRK